MITRSIKALDFTSKSKVIKVLTRGIIKQAKNEDPPPSKAARDVVSYLTGTPEYADIIDRIPKSLLRKYKAPESMYLINRNTAKSIANVLKSHIDKTSPVIEINPGFGFLSSELLPHVGYLHLYESVQQFSSCLNDLQNKQPNKISYKVNDFMSVWKLAYQDRLDSGDRLSEFLGDMATDDPERETKIVGSMPGLIFLKHFIYMLIFHHSTHQLGRPDLFVTMPVHMYEFLADARVLQARLRAVPALLQLLFEHERLLTAPAAHFLPWTFPPDGKGGSVVDESSLCLVRLRRRRLPVAPQHLPLLWYFFKPNVISKSTRVIPMLEQWIPGCGVWLISGQDPPHTDRALGPAPDDAPLPHLTIFTQFGDLTLQQKLTVFKRFISWPEFKQCPFRSTVETNLPKYISAEGDAEGRGGAGGGGPRALALDAGSDSDDEL